MPPPPSERPSPSRRWAIAGGLAVMAAFGWTVSRLPGPLIQPFIGLMAGACNLVALFFFLRRARHQASERRGWHLLAASMVVLIAANAVLTLAPERLSSLRIWELLFITLSLGVAALQVAALLSWPFRPQVEGSHRILNHLGSLLFVASLFLCTWSIAMARVWDSGQWPMLLLMLGISSRTTFVGGVAAYLLADDPRRVRGPVGWIFLGMMFQTLTVLLARPHLYSPEGLVQPSKLFALSLGIPLAYLAAAAFPDPVEVPESAPRSRSLLIEALLFLPFLAAGGVVIHSRLNQPEHHLGLLIGFMLVAVVLVVRQLILLRGLRQANEGIRRANERLEERVQARTQALEELQAALLRTERMNSMAILGAGLAHDLNNALQSVRGCIELSLEELEDGTPVAKADLAKVLLAADHAVAMTGRLMSFGRKGDGADQDTDLATTLAALEPLLRMLLPRGIRLHLDLAPGPLAVPLSKAQVEQIVVNLVANARDAMLTEGAITLGLRREDGPSPPCAVLSVQDTGEGMAPEVKARIFETFYTTKAQGRGTGLGLASVQHLMDEAGGSIEVDSAPGLGTTFRLRFPLEA